MASAGELLRDYSVRYFSVEDKYCIEVTSSSLRQPKDQNFSQIMDGESHAKQPLNNKICKNSYKQQKFL